MELPRNITQIGEADRRCKVYVEDYVLSYIRQINRQAHSRTIAVALFGIRREEGEIGYYFMYGACRIESLTSQVRHLSQAQNQEAEKARAKYFPEYQFLGYRLLDGEMVEGFHICEQGICRYISGYACFYEKNDSMLAYMLDTRIEETQPEQVEQEKFDRLRQRQENRRQDYQKTQEARKLREARTGRRFDRAIWNQENTDASQDGAAPDQEGTVLNQKATFRNSGNTASPRDGITLRKALVNGRNAGRDNRNNRNNNNRKDNRPSVRLQGMRAAVVAVFALLCVAGFFSLGGTMGNWQDTTAQLATQFLAQLTEQKLPDSEERISAMNQSAQNSILVAEDKLTETIAQENEAGASTPSGELPSAATGEENTQEDGETDNNSGESNEDINDNISDDNSKSEESNGSSADSDNNEESGSEGGSGDNNVTAADNVATEESNVTTENQSEPVAYIIQKGDTLTAISISHYGTDAMVSAICTLNNITNPDDIYFGQKILLP